MNRFDSVKNLSSWGEFVDWQFINGSKYVKSPFDFLAQDFDWQKGILYRFFDSKNIIIEVQSSFDSNINFSWEIKIPYDISCVTVSKFESLSRTRPEAELEAFSDAFLFLDKHSIYFKRQEENNNQQTK